MKPFDGMKDYWPPLKQLDNPVTLKFQWLGGFEREFPDVTQYYIDQDGNHYLLMADGSKAVVEGTFAVKTQPGGVWAL